MNKKTTEQLVEEAVTTSGESVTFDGLEFRRIVRRNPANGNLVTSMINPRGSGYMAVKKTGEKRLRKICEAMIAEAPATRARIAAESRAFLDR